MMENYWYFIVDDAGKYLAGDFENVRHARSYAWLTLMNDRTSVLLSRLKGGQARICRQHIVTGKRTFYEL